MSSEGERSDEPKCSLFTKCNPNNRLNKRQTWHGMNGLDSPTAGNNINTRQELKARTWLLITNTEETLDKNKPMGT